MDIGSTSESSPPLRRWSAATRFLNDHVGLVGVIGLLVTLVFGYGATRLEFATGQDSYLNSDDQVLIDNVEYQDLFGGQAVLVLFTMNDGSTVTDLTDGPDRDELTRLAREFESHGDLITNVVTPLTALEWTDHLLTIQPDGQPAVQPTASVAGRALLAAAANDPTEEGRSLRAADALKTAQRLADIPVDQRTMDNREWIDFLLHDNSGAIRKAQVPVFPDETHAQMVVRLVGNASIDIESEGSDLVRNAIEDSVASGHFAKTTTTVTGASFLLGDINAYLKGGMIQLGAIAVVVMMIILLVLFDVRWRLLPLVVILFGVTWAFGLAGYIGIPLSLVTIAGLPVMLGIGIDFAIQLHSRVEEEVAVGCSPEATARAAHGLAPALLIATVSAMIAFAVLLLAKVPMLRQLGLLLAIGIGIIYIASLVIPLTVLGRREQRSPTHSREPKALLGNLTARLGSLPAAAAPYLIVGAVLIIGAGIAVENHLEIQSDPVEWVNQSSRSIRDFRRVERETGSSSELAVFIQTSPDAVFAQETVDFISDYARELLDTYGDAADIPAGHISPELLTATSLVTTVDYIIDLPGASPVNPRAEDVEGAYAVAPEAIRRSTVNEQSGAQNLIFRYGDRSLDERSSTVDAIRDDLSAPEGTRTVPSGLAVVGVGLLENLQANRVLLTYVVMVAVFVFLALRFHSIVRALLTLVPVMIAVGIANLTAFILRLKLSPMTAVGGPIVVAVCTEFTVLIMMRYLAERHRGLAPSEAVDLTARRTGRAFIVSGLTAISGVAVIASSSLPLLRDFGIVVGMNVAVALISALTILPPLLVWADARGWISGGRMAQEAPEAT